MITTRARHTPYDYVIEHASVAEIVKRYALRREGYLCAKSEDADLLVALEEMSCTCYNPTGDFPHDRSNADCNLSIARAAIAKAEGPGGDAVTAIAPAEPHQHRLVATENLRWLWCPDCGESVQALG